jgi:N-methylhydantoinase A/oxoprolinase/acetone carboxylase beta subunit
MWLRTSLVAPVLMLISISTSWGQAPLPDSRFGTRTAPLLLLGRPDVRADLGLGPKQVEESDHAIGTLYARAAALKGKTGPEVVKAREQIDAEEQHWLKKHLTEAQYARLHQIDLQWEGATALISRKAVATRLKLHASQIEALRHAVAKRNEERKSGAHDPALEANFERTAMAILNETQREEWKQLLGHPFKLQLAEGQSHPRQ